MLLLKYSLFLQETYFTIIVQRNTLYQTGADLQESLMCIYDLSDISVGNNVNVGYVFVSLKMGFIWHLSQSSIRSSLYSSSRK